MVAKSLREDWWQDRGDGFWVLRIQSLNLGLAHPRNNKKIDKIYENLKTLPRKRLRTMLILLSITSDTKKSFQNVEIKFKYTDTVTEQYYPERSLHSVGI